MQPRVGACSVCIIICNCTTPKTCRRRLPRRLRWVGEASPVYNECRRWVWTWSLWQLSRWLAREFARVEQVQSLVRVPRRPRVVTPRTRAVANGQQTSRRCQRGYSTERSSPARMRVANDLHPVESLSPGRKEDSTPDWKQGALVVSVDVDGDQKKVLRHVKECLSIFAYLWNSGFWKGFRHGGRPRLCRKCMKLRKYARKLEEKLSIR